MTARLRPPDPVVRSVVRAVILALLVVGPSVCSADPWLPLRHGPTREVSLAKPPHEDLRIRWSAAVHEEGGEFLITRQAAGGSTSEVKRVRLRGDGRYEVVEQSAAGSWTYKLRYRDRRGQELILAIIHLNVERLDARHGVLNPGAPGPPAAQRPEALLPMPDAWAAAFPAWEPIATSGPGRWPPTPPP